MAQAEEIPKEALLFLGKIRHVHAAFTTTQNRTKRDHQKLLEIMPTRIPRARVRNPGKAIPKPVHPIHRKPLTSSLAESKTLTSATHSVCDSPGGAAELLGMAPILITGL